jgi:hypothetical protein
LIFTFHSPNDVEPGFDGSTISRQWNPKHIPQRSTDNSPSLPLCQHGTIGIIDDRLGAKGGVRAQSSEPDRKDKRVDQVESKQGFVITDPAWNGLYGTIAKGAEPRTLVVDENATATLPFDSVIQIEQLGQTFLKRLRGDFDLGLSFAKSNEQKNLTLQGDLS